LGRAQLGWAEISLTKMTLLGSGLGWNKFGPPSKLIILPLHAKYLLHAMAMKTRRRNGEEEEGGHLTRVGGAAGLGG